MVTNWYPPQTWICVTNENLIGMDILKSLILCMLKNELENIWVISTLKCMTFLFLCCMELGVVVSQCRGQGQWSRACCATNLCGVWWGHNIWELLISETRESTKKRLTCWMMPSVSGRKPWDSITLQWVRTMNVVKNVCMLVCIYSPSLQPRSAIHNIFISSWPILSHTFFASSMFGSFMLVHMHTLHHFILLV